MTNLSDKLTFREGALLSAVTWVPCLIWALLLKRHQEKGGQHDLG